MNIPITIIPDAKKGFTIICNALGFVTEGDTMEEALANAKEAAACHIEGLNKLKDSEEQEYLKGLDKSFSTFVTV